jgi:protein gp37
MSDGTKIEWTDATWNPITGCSVVSAGCKHCYAMKLAGTRLQHHPSRAGLTVDTKNGPVWTGEVRFNEQWLDQPLRWKKPRMVFVCAHADLFHEAVPDEWIDRVFAAMELASQHTFQVLTKRADRMRKYLRFRQVVLPNVWLGVSVEDQAAADERIPLLLDTPAAVRWVSAEPLLGPVDLTRVMHQQKHSGWSFRWDSLTGFRGHQCGGSDNNSRLDWVIVGGESGPKARPMHPAWARSLRDQCAAAGVPFLFKQWGEWAPFRIPGGITMVESSEPHVAWPDGQIANGTAEEHGGPGSQLVRVGKKRAGRLLDGVQHDGYPGGAA